MRKNTFKSAFKPMIAVGVNASDKKWASENQYQNCAKTNIPTTAAIFV